MRALLPKLMFAFDFVRGAKIPELVEQPLATLVLEFLNEATRGVALKVRQDT